MKTRKSDCHLQFLDQGMNPIADVEGLITLFEHECGPFTFWYGVVDVYEPHEKMAALFEAGQHQDIKIRIELPSGESGLAKQVFLQASSDPLYGVAPAEVLPKLMDISVEQTDLIHVFRAIMGLYLGMIVLWIIGAFNSDFVRAAVISEIAFMFGTAVGRTLSLIVDGVPNSALILYTIVEFVFGFWGIFVLKQLANLSSAEHQG